jgi:hypothetical protein
MSAARYGDRGCSEMQQENRQQYLTECKRHACVYLDKGDLKQAVASMASEITRHGWTPGSWGYAALVSEGLRYALQNDAEGVRRWIDGF